MAEAITLRAMGLVGQTSKVAARMSMDQVTTTDMDDFEIVERVCSTLSLLGCLFIAVTFLGSKAFHKPINRLVFYASMGNVFTNIATIISRAAITDTTGGLCQFQAFLIQMFMPADAYWTLAMAVNVYLTFYWKFDGEALRRLEKYYIMICYGAPFVPAFVYLWAKTPDKGRMYGNATLWCWVANDWDVIRIYTFYGPVWVVILLTTAIYIRAGREIYNKRKQLRDFSGSQPDPPPIMSDPFQSVKTTEVFVTSEVIESRDYIDLEDLGRPGPTTQYLSRPQAAAHKNNYTVTVSSPQANLQSQPQCNSTETSLPGQGDRKYSILNVPSSAHGPNSDRANLYPTRRLAVMEANSATWSYTKVAVLFFVAMMVTWIPSSANRVYSVVHPGQVSLGLEFASAFVLPLQGFWNALIYATTSLPACKQVWAHIRDRNRMSGGSLKQMTGGQKQQSRKQYVETDSMTELASRPETKGSSR
ncbi:Cyclic AMP receptor 2 [Hyphodiscus hymeniophilus]|uniref:Cyclic AMP receptor 2 n=1 Tax=Hyphodiscus hymeniophilus TaxID=353542 RepID=A0A9P7AUS5_9HELO|nr:Cyclic AMP receptor 2 [Hyphodiscus hymeniophilus]